MGKVNILTVHSDYNYAVDILRISTIPALLFITWIPINPYSLEDGTSSLTDVNVTPI